MNLNQIEKKEICYPDDWKEFKIFAKLHPVEAYDSRKRDFLLLMKQNGNSMSEKEIEGLINEYR